MEKLFVLKYKIADLEIYLTPDGSHSTDILDAIKFQREQTATEYRSAKSSLFEFEVSLEEIPHKPKFSSIID